MPAPVIEAIEAFDRDLRNEDVVARNRLAAAYRRAWLPILEEMNFLRRAVENAPTIPIIRGDGTTGFGIPPSWTFQHERYQALQTAVRAAVYEMATELGDVTLGGQAAAWETGIDEARAAARALAEVDPRSFATPPRGAFQAYTAGAQQGPLDSLLQSFIRNNGTAARDYTRDLIGAGLMQGRAPQSIARELEGAIRGLTQSRAETIARTEILRAYREAAYRSYTQNPDIVQSWTWRAAVENSRPPPCAACFGRHGQIFPITQRMEPHPRCRCRMVPRRSPIYGQVPEDPVLTDRDLAFSRLPVSAQRQVLGPTRLAGWRSGTWRMDDFATSRGRGLWGTNNAAIRPIYELRSLSRDPRRSLDFASRRLFETSARAEPRVSAFLQDVASRLDARLAGFGFRLKATNRISEKIYADVLDGRGLITATSQGINDALRYTLELTPAQFSDGVRIALAEARARGHRILDSKNFYLHNYTVARHGATSGYRGFHAVIQEPGGARYELQFHTAETLRRKEPSHLLYEVQRVATSPAERKRIQEEIGELWQDLEFPPGVEGLLDL